MKSSTLDQHFEETLCRVRAEFERSGEVQAVFHCVTDVERFDVPAHWSDRSAKAAICAALRDTFHRRGVNRYLFASEGWVGKTRGLAPADDPARGECVQVLAVERSGRRKFAFAEITRTEQMTTLGPWEVNGEADIPQSWLLELLGEGHSDRRAKAEPPPVNRMSNANFQDLADQHPEQAAELNGSLEIHTELGHLVSDEIQKRHGDPMAMYMALESVLRSIVKEMGSPKGLGQFARFLRDHPDKFPMFPTVPNQVPSTQHVRSCKDRVRQFSCEKREAGHTHFAIFQAFMNMYMWVGAQAVGALSLGDRIEDWDPEHQAKLEQAGLRSSFELDDEEGKVFAALSAERYPFGVMGRRNAVGDLFVSRVVAFAEKHFAAAVDKIEESGIELINGSAAEELLCKMEQAKGIALRAEKNNEIWEVENWGHDEWAEQVLAEIAFAKAMKIQHVPECNKFCGSVAGYRVRRASSGLVLVPSDNDDDIFVAVKVETTKSQANILGWLLGSEGKVPQFYRKNCWVIPAEALHDMETLPGKDGLRTMPPFQELSPEVGISKLVPVVPFLQLHQSKRVVTTSKSANGPVRSGSKTHFHKIGGLWGACVWTIGRLTLVFWVLFEVTVRKAAMSDNEMQSTEKAGTPTVSIRAEIWHALLEIAGRQIDPESAEGLLVVRPSGSSLRCLSQSATRV